MSLFDRLRGRQSEVKRLFDDFHESLGDAELTLSEVISRRDSYIEENIPRGPEALLVAREAGLLSVKPSLFEDGAYPNSDLLARSFADAGIRNEWEGDGGPPLQIFVGGDKPWTEVLHASPQGVKQAFGIPEDADPQRTMELLSEGLLAADFRHRSAAKIEAPMDRQRRKEALSNRKQEERERRAVAEQARKQDPHQLVVDAIGKPVLSELDEAPARPSQGRSHDGLGL